MKTFKNQTEISEKIHSGQFMVSKYDEESDCEDTSDCDLKEKVYNFECSLSKKNFNFINGSQCGQKLKIDESLSTMLRYLSITMSGKITNPKWNSFKGVKVQPKDKIRLNNIIWREYHMQFVKKRNPVVVQFANPLSDVLQINGNVGLEGKYWKKRINIIVHQYKKWREFSKNRVISEDHKEKALFDSIIVQRSLYHKLYSNSPPPNLNDIFMDLDDLNLPIDDITGVHLNSQIIQPQLTNLQPRMESSIEFLNGYFYAPYKNIKNQKSYSSETCLSVKPVINNTKNNYFQHPIETCNNLRMETTSTRLPTNIPYELNSYRMKNFKSNRNTDIELNQRQQPEKFSSTLQFCKTPNLLSILLQPISSEVTQLKQEQTSSRSNSMDIVPNKQSLVITTTNYTKHNNVLDRVSDSSIKYNYEYEPVRHLDADVQKQDFNEISFLNVKKTSKSVQSSIFNRSARMKQTLTANNAVQQYIEELSELLMPIRNQNKLSKADLLHKASNHIKRLRIQKSKLQSEIKNLQNEIDSLQTRFSDFCSQLPATGVCVNNKKTSEDIGWFEGFVTRRSLVNWKFYIFSMMFESLFTGYNNSVSTQSTDKLAHSVISWIEEECSLMKLRLIVINGMRILSRRTSIVHSPAQLEEEIKYLIKNSIQTQGCIDLANLSSCYVKEGNEESFSEPRKLIRLKCTTKSWPKIFIANPYASSSLERQDV